MTSPKDVVDYLLETLAASLTTVKEFHKGEPPQSRYAGFPFVWVEWTGGRQTPSTVNNRMRVEDVYYVVAVDRHPEEDKAEDKVMDFVESIESTLAVDRTLGSLVIHSYVSNREKQKAFSSDYSVVAARVTLTTFRKKS